MSRYSGTKTYWEHYDVEGVVVKNAERQEEANMRHVAIVLRLRDEDGKPTGKNRTLVKSYVEEGDASREAMLKLHHDVIKDHDYADVIVVGSDPFKPLS